VSLTKDRPKAVSKHACSIDSEFGLCYNGDVGSRAAPQYRLLFAQARRALVGVSLTPLLLSEIVCTWQGRRKLQCQGC